MYYAVTRDDDEGDRADDKASASDKGARREDAKKERVLHTRVPAVLEAELKRLAKTLRVPVSNVVRAILEDAVDAVDTVSERAEGELMGFVDRLAKQRDELRHRVTGDEREARDEDETPRETVIADASACPSEPPAALEGVFGYQPLILAAATTCDVCGRALRAGSEAHRALFDDPGRRIFLGPECRLVPNEGK